MRLTLALELGDYAIYFFIKFQEKKITLELLQTFCKDIPQIGQSAV